MQAIQKPAGIYEGSEVFEISLTGAQCTVNILNYGAVIKDILFGDEGGRVRNLVLHYDEVADYFTDPSYMGSVVGRYAGRIAGGQLRLDGRDYRLSLNEGGNHLHGGFRGFNRKVWQVETLTDGPGMAGVVLKTFTPDGDEGYPGNLEASVTYMLSEDGELSVTYQARTDSPTIVNLTNHTYFNLSGEGAAIAPHELMIAAETYTPTDSQHIPDGTIRSVSGTPFDLRTPQPLSRVMTEIRPVNYCLNNGGVLSLAAVLTYPDPAICLEVWTTAPGFQLYLADYLSGKYPAFSGICLEPQYYPDSPHHPAFPQALLSPGDAYLERTCFRFSRRR